MPHNEKAGKFPVGNSLLYISLLSVALIASFTSSAILNNLFAICNSRLLPTNQIVNYDGRVRPQGRTLFCFVFDLLIHGSDCIRSNTLKNGMPEADASKLPTSPIFQKDLTFPGSSI